MALVRVYTSNDGVTHFEDVELFPPDVQGDRSSVDVASTNISFFHVRDGVFHDWHNAAQRNYIIFMSGGQMEVQVGDGTVRRFGVGDAVLFEDLTGQGHIARNLGDMVFALVVTP